MDSSNSPYQAPSQAGYAGRLGLTKMTPKEILTSFSGRIPRQTFWIWSIAMWGFLFVAGFIIGLVFGPSTPPPGEMPKSPGIIFSLLMLVLCISAIWVGIALQVKRWHDRGMSGWWVLISLIPLVGAVRAFVECGCLRGTVGRNQFGEDPTEP